jgi:hypothetical protein
MPARPIGRLIKKMLRQPESAINAPPTNGPAVSEKLAPAAQIPTAQWRSRSCG